MLNTLKDVIQATGRNVRSKDDYAVNYILDSSFRFLYNKSISYAPKWWSSSIVFVDV